MRRCLVAFAALSPLFVLAADPPAEKDKDKDKDKDKPALRVGANIPGPFHPYNVNGRYGPRKIGEVEVDGTYHCPVTEHAEDPMVLVFTRDLDVGEKLKTLLQKLEAATKNNTKVRLAATVVFLDDKLKDEVIGQTDATDDRRRELAASLREKLAGLFTETNEFTKQNLVVVCIGCDKDLKKVGYQLDQNHKVTVVMYNKLEIRAVHAVAELDDAHIDAIMKDVADKLGATKK
jgi:hypothetical protein